MILLLVSAARNSAVDRFLCNDSFVRNSDLVISCIVFTHKTSMRALLRILGLWTYFFRVEILPGLNSRDCIQSSRTMRICRSQLYIQTGLFASLEETEGNEEPIEGHMRINEARSIGLDTKEASQRNVAFAS